MIPATSFLRIWLFLYKSYKKVNLTASYLDLIRNSFTVEYLIIWEITLFFAPFLLSIIFNLFRDRIIPKVCFLARPRRYIATLSTLWVLSIEYLNKEVGALSSFSRIIINCRTCSIVSWHLRALLIIIWQSFQLALPCQISFRNYLRTRNATIGALHKQAFLPKLVCLKSSIKLICN